MDVLRNELVVIERLNAVDVFTGPQGVEKIIAEIEALVATFTPDTTTPKGRKDIASLAYKVSQSKVMLDDLGKGLVTDWKAKAALVDAARKTVRDRLDELRDKARAPLTEWEEEEKTRIAAELMVKEIEAAHDAALAEHSLWLRAKEIEAKEAELAKVEAERMAKETAERLAKEEAERLAREEQERKEREERIRLEAAEKAQRDAEEKAAAALAEAERKEREAREAAEKSERDRIAAEKRAEEEKQAAVRSAEEKARAEALRIENERLAKEAAEKAAADRKLAEEKRKADDVEHRRNVNQEAMNGLVAAGLNEKQAQAVIISIVGGLVKHVSVNY